jgi:hypothetical protein
LGCFRDEQIKKKRYKAIFYMLGPSGNKRYEALVSDIEQCPLVVCAGWGQYGGV